MEFRDFLRPSVIGINPNEIAWARVVLGSLVTPTLPPRIEITYTIPEINLNIVPINQERFNIPREIIYAETQRENTLLNFARQIEQDRIRQSDLILTRQQRGTLNEILRAQSRRSPAQQDSDFAQAYANSFREMYRETPVEIPVGANAVTLEALDYRGWFDPSYICPISGQIMTNPYSHPSQSGTFEKDFIKKALDCNPKNPLTRQPMKFSDLKLDEKKKFEIDSFVQGLSAWLPKQRKVNEQIPNATLKPMRFSQAPQREEQRNDESHRKIVKNSI